MTFQKFQNPLRTKLRVAAIQKAQTLSARLRLALAMAGILIMAGCSSTEKAANHSTHTETSGANPLRVAVAPYYPPLVFEQGDSITGVEVELANLLGKELNRPVEFVKLKREDLINAIQDGRADIIMSGMSVTKARQIRAKFSEPYLHNQLRAIFKRINADKFHSPEEVKASTSRIGVLAGTTADVFVQQNCPYATRIVLQNRRDVTFWLTEGGKIDLYVDDSFALAQIVSANEAALAYLPQPLAEDDLAWAVAPGQEQLLQQVNEYLARWKATGQLDIVLEHWMPYLKKR